MNLHQVSETEQDMGRLSMGCTGCTGPDFVECFTTLFGSVQ